MSKPNPEPSDEKLTPGGMIMKLANERANPEPSARECKVRITCDGVAEFVEFVRNTDVTDGELIHLIEYSAFERLQAEWQKEHTAKVDAKFDRDRLQTALDAACGEIDKARAELTKIEFSSYAKVAIDLEKQLTAAREREGNLVSALKKTKAAIWCENVDQENEAYELAREVLLEHAKENK